MAETQTETTNGMTARKGPRRKSAATKRRPAKRSSRVDDMMRAVRPTIRDRADLAYREGRRMVEDGASRAYEQGRNVAERAYTAAGDAMRDMRIPDRQQLVNFAEHNPLILGAVGLGLGVVIGTLLPRYGTMMPSMPSMSQTPRRNTGRRKPTARRATARKTSRKG